MQPRWAMTTSPSPLHVRALRIPSPAFPGASQPLVPRLGSSPRSASHGE